MGILNAFFANTDRARGTTATKPLRLTTTGEHELTDHDNLRIWERVIKDVIEHSTRTLSRITNQIIRARLFSLELISEKDTIDRLGGATTTVTALYLHPNMPDSANNCLMLAFQAELASFFAKFTQQTTKNSSEQPAQAGENDLYEISDMLACSLARTIADLYRTRLHYSPPVIVIDNAQTVIELARTEVSDRQCNSQFLAGAFSLSASSSYFEGVFILHCSVSIEKIAKWNTGLFDGRMTSCTPISYDLLPRRV